MALSITWATKTINVPQADLTSLGGALYQLDANAFRNALKNLEGGEDGMAFPPTLRHATALTLSGVTYARQLEIINGYTVTFQNTGTPYVVKVVGANHNLGDVTNFDGGMSLIIGNSGGLQTVATGSGVTAQDKADIAAATLAAAQVTPIHSDMRKAVGQSYHGDGSTSNKLRSTLVP